MRDVRLAVGEQRVLLTVAWTTALVSKKLRERMVPSLQATQSVRESEEREM